MTPSEALQAYPVSPHDWRDMHPEYGPCDGFGPGGTCCMCSGIIGRNDGSTVSVFGGDLELAQPTPTEAALQALAQAAVEFTRAVGSGTGAEAFMAQGKLAEAAANYARATQEATHDR